MNETFGRSIQKAHDKVAPYYGDYDQRIDWQPDPLLIQRYEQLWDAVGLKGREPVLLDAGCGNGNFFDLFRSLGVRQILGVDFSSRMLFNAHQRDPEARLIQSDLNALAMRSELVDVIHCYGVIEHVEALLPLFMEFHRVLKHGGLLILDVPVRGSLSHFTHILFGISPSKWGFRHRIVDLFRYREKLRYFRFYDIGTVMELAKSAGMEEVTCVPTRYFYAHGVLHSFFRTFSFDISSRAFRFLEGITMSLLGKPSGYLLLLGKNKQRRKGVGGHPFR